MSKPVILALPVLLTAVLLYRRGRRNMPLPPGPTGLPLIGNLFDIPKDYGWITYAEWGRKYGEQRTPLSNTVTEFRLLVSLRLGYFARPNLQQLAHRSTEFDGRRCGAFREKLVYIF